MPCRRRRYGWTALPWIGPGPDDRDLDHEVVEAAPAATSGSVCIWARVSTWKTPDRVGGPDHLEDLGHVLRQPVEVETDRAVVLDELERLVDRGEHAEAEQVELDELERLDVALVALDDDPVGHRGPLERARCR